MAHQAFSLLERNIGESSGNPTGCTLLRHQSGSLVLQAQMQQGLYGFAIGFPTPASDDSGLSHVLEHMVFRGSQLHGDNHLYAAMRSGSLAYHLNASTGPEMTSYHFATPNRQDALLLQEALLAAVFTPLLRPEAFHEEAFDPKSGKGGIVYNEMLGHLAGLPARLEHELRRGLFGAAPAGWCYGGRPEALRSLALTRLRDYHRFYYHPAKALVLLSGEEGDGRRLALLDTYFKGAAPEPNSPFPRVAPHIAQGEIAGHFYWGMIFPETLSQGEKQMLGESLLQKARTAFGARLLAQSGFIDGFQPYLALYGQGALPIDLGTWAQDIGPQDLAVAREALQNRLSDAEDNPRLPAPLQLWPRLCAAHLRGDLKEAFAPLPPPSQGLVHRLQTIAATLPFGDETASRAVKAPPVAADCAPKPLGFFKALPLSQISTAPPSPAILLERGLVLLQGPEGGFVRLCLWCDGGRLTAAEGAMLPALAASAAKTLAAKVQCYNGNRLGLLIETRLESAAVAAWLGRCETWFDAPEPVSGTSGLPLPLAAEIHLRAGFSPEWQKIDESLGLGQGREAAQSAPERGALCALAKTLRPHVKAATTSDAILALLEPWSGPEAPPQIGAAPAYPPLYRLPRQSILAAPEALFTLGLGVEMQDIAQEGLLVARKALEGDYLWPELRSKAGSYGIRSSQTDGILTMISLRDPQGPASLAVMEAAGQWLADHGATPEVLHRAKLAALGEILQPKARSLLLREALLPAKGAASAEAVLVIGAEEIQQLAQSLLHRLPQSQHLVIASGETLAAHGLRPNP